MKGRSRLTHRPIIFTLFYLIVAWSFLTILSYRLILIFFPSCNVAVENNIVFFIQRILASEPLYANPSRPVYAIAQYTPLYYYLIAALSKIFSIDQGQVLQLVLINKAVSLLLDLSVCFLLIKILTGIFNSSKKKALVTAAIAFVFMLPWSRIDNLSVLLWLTTLFFFFKFILFPRNALYFSLSVFFSVLCFLTKQSGMTIIIMIAAWLFLSRQYKRAAWYCVMMILLICAAFFILSLSSPLNSIYQNIILGVNNGISLVSYFNIFISYYSGEGLIFITGFIASLFFLSREKAEVHRFFLMLLIFQFLFANLFALKDGSGINYLTEWTLLVIIALSLFFHKVSQMLSFIHLNLTIVLLASIVLLKSLTYWPHIIWFGNPSNLRAAKQYFLTEQNVAAYLKTKTENERTFVMTDIMSYDTYLSNLLPGKLLFPQSDVSVTVYNRNVYDFSAFRNQLRHKQIKYIVSKKQAETLQLYDTVFSNLRQDTAISDFFIYAIQ